jgi:hypothetical protein
MRLYFFTTDNGCFEFLFTTDEQRAIQLFSIYVVLGKVQPTRMWFSELTPTTVIPEHRQHLEEALARQVEAFASYERPNGWVMVLAQDRFDQLSHEAGEGGVR